MAQNSSGKPPRGDEDDLSLWRKVARTVSPLTRGRDRLAKEAAPVKPPAPSRPQPKRKTGAQPPPPPSQSKRPPAPPPLNRFDAREERRLAIGKTDIDARIDLHGMRQREAHTALRAFLLRAQGRGHKIVLVITGKGAPRGSGDHEAGDGRGVLRRAVPIWLDEPEMRQVVVGHTAAHIRHGGDGALYVRLRKQRASNPRE